MGQRRFAPFFWTQFLGAANDNLFKFAFTVMVTYQLQVSWLPADMAGLVIGALFILPFLLFSATSGQLADKLDRRLMINGLKWAEIAIMVVAAWGFWAQSMPLLLGCVFMMGLQSAVFGPVKFAYMPQHLSERELTGGNGMVEMGTFVAILLGQVAGGLIVALPEVGAHYVGISCIALALLGRLASQFIPGLAGHGPRAAHQLEPGHRDLGQPEARPRNAGGVPLGAGHQLDVVLWCGVPEPVPRLCERGVARRRTGGFAAAGGVLRGHRHRLAAV